jgi:hypothetical protein
MGINRMIVTRELLVSLVPCQEALDWADAQDWGANRWSMTRGEYIRTMRENNNTPEEYMEWITSTTEGLYSVQAMLAGNDTQILDIWKVHGHGLNFSVEHTDLAALKQAMAAAIQSRIDEESFAFHVQARQIINEVDGYIATCVDSDTHMNIPADHYVAFNMYTGAYEQFATFAQADARNTELKNIRRTEISDTYHVYQKIQEVNDPEENAVNYFHIGTASTLL